MSDSAAALRVECSIWSFIDSGHTHAQSLTHTHRFMHMHTLTVKVQVHASHCSLTCVKKTHRDMKPDNLASPRGSERLL